MRLAAATLGVYAPILSRAEAPSPRDPRSEFERLSVAICRLVQEKRAPPNQGGCCQDFANPCEVPVFPPDVDFERRDHWSEYGPNGLYWPYGGSGTFLSAGLVVDVVGADGWALCARMFTRMNTDIQVNLGRYF